MLRDETITVFGGSGFIGRYVVRDLAKAGYRVRVATRNPHLAYELKPLGRVGQIQLMQANIRDRSSVERAVENSWGAVNLVGVLAEQGRQSFTALQARGAGTVAEAAREAGVKRFVHISAIGADPDSPSKYARTKALGERAVLEAMPEATILRPSIVFGAEDEFLNKFADMARFAPALPLIGGGKTRFQPVFVGDVALSVVRALEDERARGRIYELGGPKIYTFKALMVFILETIRRRRALVPLPWPLASMTGLFGEIAGKAPFVEPFLTRDQVNLLKQDNVVGAGGEDVGRIEDLGVTPETMEAVAPTFLARYRKGGQFAEDIEALESQERRDR